MSVLFGGFISISYHFIVSSEPEKCDENAFCQTEDTKMIMIHMHIAHLIGRIFDSHLAQLSCTFVNCHLKSIHHKEQATIGKLNLGLLYELRNNCFYSRD